MLAEPPQASLRKLTSTLWAPAPQVPFSVSVSDCPSAWLDAAVSVPPTATPSTLTVYCACPFQASSLILSTIVSAPVPIVVLERRRPGRHVEGGGDGRQERGGARGHGLAVVGDAVDVEVAVGAGRAAPGVVEEAHLHLVRARAPASLQRQRVGLPERVAGGRRQHAADLHAVHLDRVLRVPVPGVLADLQHQRVRARADRDVDRDGVRRLTGSFGRMTGGVLPLTRHGEGVGGVLREGGGVDEGRRASDQRAVGVERLLAARQVVDGGQAREGDLGVVAADLPPAVAVGVAAGGGLRADLGPGLVDGARVRVADGDQVGHAVMHLEAAGLVGEPPDEEVHLPLEEGERVGVARARRGRGGGGEVVLLPLRHGAGDAVVAGHPAMRLALPGRPFGDLGDEVLPVAVGRRLEEGLLGAAVRRGPGGLVDLAQAPGGGAHLGAAGHDVGGVHAGRRPLAHDRGGGLGLDVVEDPALAGHQERHVGEVGLVRGVVGPAGVPRDLLRQPAGAGIAGLAVAAARVRPEVGVVVRVQPGLVGGVPEVDGHGARGVGLAERVGGRARVLRHQPGGVGLGGDADVGPPAGAGHVGLDAVRRERRAPAGGGHLRGHAGDEGAVDADGEVVVRDRAGRLEIGGVVLDVEPAGVRAAEPLPAAAAGAEGLVPVLVLRLIDGLVGDHDAVELGLEGVVHPAAARLHGVVVVEGRVDRQPAALVGGDVEEHPLRARQVDGDARLGRELALLPEGGGAVGERRLEGREDVDAGGRATGRRHVHLEGVGADRLGEVDCRRRGDAALGQHDVEGGAGREVRPLEREHDHLGGAVGVGALHVHLDGDRPAADLRDEPAPLRQVAHLEDLAEGGHAALQGRCAGVLELEGNDSAGPEGREGGKSEL